MPKKLIELSELKASVSKIKEYFDKKIKELEGKITNFTVKDKTTAKTYTLEMDNGLVYFDDGEDS